MFPDAVGARTDICMDVAALARIFYACMGILKKEETEEQNRTRENSSPPIFGYACVCECCSNDSVLRMYVRFASNIEVHIIIK